MIIDGIPANTELFDTDTLVTQEPHTGATVTITHDNNFNEADGRNGGPAQAQRIIFEFDKDLAPQSGGDDLNLPDNEVDVDAGRVRFVVKIK